jgi:hypothetical protein
MSDDFIVWYQVRYGVYPTTDQYRVAYPLWKWSRRPTRMFFREAKSKVINRHIARRLAA